MSDLTTPLPDDLEACFTLGCQRLAAADWPGAEAALRRALTLDPECGEVWANLALVLEHAGQWAAAEQAHRRAVAALPEVAQVHFNLGALLYREKQLIAAEPVFRNGLALAPGSAAGWSGLGVVLAAARRDAAAETALRRALELDPDYARARFSLSYLLLRQGRLAEGWPALAAREQFEPVPAPAALPRWQGGDLHGQRLLIVCNVGHGDLIQFLRYVPLLRQRGATRVGVLAQPALLSVLQTLEGIDVLVPLGGHVEAADWDCWTLPFDLPRWCATRLHSIPAAIPYLHADPARCARWQPRLPGGRPRVGLVWRGNPSHENDSERSLPGLASLAPLSQVAGLAFVSLQHGADAAAALAPPAGLSLTPLGGEFSDFADTAAVLAQLDLLISVDTAVAHLAGALGRPCWLLLPDYLTDWRWLERRNDSPWYPGHRLFRQPRPGDWAEVIRQVRTALSDWLASHVNCSASAEVCQFNLRVASASRTNVG
ncbi:MAG: hypothetical protein RIR00_2045 [Pseudomonadota bacterium]|jgi:Flp pilus assembly protein TadD